MTRKGFAGQSYQRHSARAPQTDIPNAQFLPIRHWVASQFKAQLQAFHKRVGKEWPTHRASSSCPGVVMKWGFMSPCSSYLQVCIGCRIICCTRPGCDVAIDDTSGCVDHPATVYCGACRKKLKPNLPELVGCPDCQRTWCREEFSWFIGRPAASKESPTGPRGTPRIHEPKPLCPERCTNNEDERLDPFPRNCCAENCWSKETGGALANMASRSICGDCIDDQSGSECRGRDLWICHDCKGCTGPSPLRICEGCGNHVCKKCTSSRPTSKVGWNCAECHNRRYGADEDDSESEADEVDCIYPEQPPCDTCNLWTCAPCDAGPTADDFI
ncbi:hypothetical protein B0H11DRAFT_1951200 [Mycena galericulata]|nr:hypothetical protein B0H11DRAFT_1951200 [Mycena galericulata]